MTTRLESKYKINRRLGVTLWGRPKSPIAKRDYGPGQHGQRRGRKPSDYGLQLRAKQRLKGYYGNMGGRPGAPLGGVVARTWFGVGVPPARQFVNHRHVRVNGKRVNIPSYQVKDGDVIEVKEKSRDLAVVLEAAASAGRG